MNEHEMVVDRKVQPDAGNPAVVDISPNEVASPALRRLLEEVRNEETGCGGQPYAYDRAHNKHNR